MVRASKEAKANKPKASGMKIIYFTEENGGTEGWLNARLSRITGSRVKDILTLEGNTIKADFWELAAEAIITSAAIAERNSGETPMERGLRLEKEAIARFEKEVGKQVDSRKQLWMREDDEKIAITPDGGMIGETEAVEIKCLGYGRHLEAKETGKVPNGSKGFMGQVIQYFVVCEKLKTLYFVFYDPSFPAPLDFHYIIVKRKDIKDEIARYLELERETLKRARAIINKYTL